MSYSIFVRAKWLWTGAGPIQPNGCVEFPFETASKEVIDLGNYCIVPGLVNSHTHLELSDFESPIPAEASFADWLSKVVDHRRASAVSDGVARGLEESRRHGIRLMLDVSHPREESLVDQNEIDRIVFPELIATTLGRAKQTWRAALKEERRRRRLNFGLSPHAPYTTTPALIRKAVARSRQFEYPIMMHLAESRDEIEWLQTGKGRLQDFMERVVGPELLTTVRRTSLAQYVAMLSESRCAFLVHGNFLDDEALQILTRYRERIAVVHCPRTHAHFGHDANPMMELRRRGVRLVLGTDSRASNPDLSILEEARALRKNLPTIPAEEIMAMITTGPIRHLQAVAPELSVGWSLIPCDETNPARVLDAMLEDCRSALSVDQISRLIASNSRHSRYD